MDTQALDGLGDRKPASDDAAFSDDGDVTEVRLPRTTDRGEISRADTGRVCPVGGVLGSYRLLQQIGAGGMGRVFVAEHVRLGRRVALKVLRSEYSGNLEAVKRFFAEARAVNCISHENIIEVSDFVECADGPSFYIMDLLHGEDLCSLQGRVGILPLARALPIAAQVCSGLGAAHAAGIVHRDLKPDNIFLVERAGRPDFVKLLDFGVAKLMNATVDDASTFRSTIGMVVGTPDYMAPEQALGHQVNHLADIYAVGVILFEMVTGRRPFVARTAREVMVQHLTTPPPRPSRLNPAAAIPGALEELILQCLAKDPTARPQDIREVEQRLRAIITRLPAAPVAGASRASMRRRHKPMRFVVGAMLLLALAGTSAWFHLGGPLARAASFVAETRPRARANNETVAAKAAPPTTPGRSVPARSAFTIDKTVTMTATAAPTEAPRAPVTVRVLPAAAPPEPAPRARPTSPPPFHDTAPTAGELARRSAGAAAPASTAGVSRGGGAGQRFKLNRDLVLDPFE